MRKGLRLLAFGLAFLGMLGARRALAQCTLVTSPMMGIGVLSVVPRGDTILVNSIWKGHEVDRVFVFEKRKRGARASSLLLQRLDGTVQGIYTQDKEVYFATARNLEDFKGQTGTFVIKKIRNVWYLPLDSKEPDDEAWAYILTQHLERLYPLKRQMAGDGAVVRRVYAQAEDEDGARAECEAYAVQICAGIKKIKKTQVQVCDEGRWYSLEFDFECK